MYFLGAITNVKNLIDRFFIFDEYNTSFMELIRIDEIKETNTVGSFSFTYSQKRIVKYQVCIETKYVIFLFWRLWRNG